MGLADRIFEEMMDLQGLRRKMILKLRSIWGKDDRDTKTRSEEDK